MKKLIQWVKEGNGRGLKVMLIFSAIMSILSWILYRPVLTQLHTVDPQLQAVNVLWIHLGFLFGSFVSLWIFYLLVVGLSALFCKIFHLKLNKGTVWRTTSFSVISLTSITILAALVGLISLKLLGMILLITPETSMVLGLLYPIINFVAFMVISVVLFSFGLNESKETQKKK